jgi:Fimbrial assembly protein (PilN)
VRLTNISFQQNDSIATGTISGYALDDAGSGKSLEPFIKQLRNSPLFEEVVLVNVQLSTLGDKSGQRFEARFTGVAVPAQQSTEIALGSGNRAQAGGADQ